MAIKTHEELEEKTLTEVLGIFLSESQVPLSIAGGGNIPSWSVVRDRLGLQGWHTPEEAITAIEAKLKVR